MGKNKQKAINPPDLSTKGSNGLITYSGTVNEEPLKELKTIPLKVKVYREMSENDAVLAGFLNSFESLILNAKWDIEPFSEAKRHKDQAEYCKNLLFEELETPWNLFLAEALSCIIFGWSDHEILYRKDKDTGLYVWKDFAPRPQETISKWEIDKSGNWIGLWQRDPSSYALNYIPREKLLHFCPKARKRNPEGQSLLRAAYTSWFYKKRFQTLEAIRIERDARGIPVAKAPAEVLDPRNTEFSELQASLKRIVQNLSMNQDAGVVFPSDEGYSLDMLQHSNTQVSDTDVVINRYDRYMLQSLLSDFILLGSKSGSVGALANTKIQMFSTFVSILMNHIKSILQKEIKFLWSVNSGHSGKLGKILATECPKLVHSNLEELEQMMTALILQAAKKNGLITSTPATENYIREVFLPGAPKITEEEWEQGQQKQESSKGQLNGKE